MKKNLFYYLFAMLLTVGVFTSCSDDDDDKVVNPVSQTTFNSENGLQLTYNGEPMLGKKVTFTPDATNATKGTLLMEGEFDLSSILGNTARDEMSVSGGPGVFPGSASTTLPVDLTINGDQCSFSGTSETDYCTYAYSGTVSKSELKLDLSDVKLKNTTLSGTTWDLMPYDYNEDQDPIHLIWTSDKGVPVFGTFTMPIETILKLALRMELIAAGADTKVSVSDMLAMALQDVTFQEDGNIVATYKDLANGGTEWTKSPVNLAQYVVSSDNQIKLFLNPAAIIAAVNNSARAVDTSAIIQQAISTLYPLLVDGVPVAFTQADGNMSVYLDTDLLLPLLKSMVAPLFSDEEFVNMIVELMTSDPDFADMAGMATPMLQALPEIIEGTTQIEIGLNFIQAN